MNNNSNKGSSKLITAVISIIAVILAAIFGGKFLLNDEPDKNISLSESSVAFTQDETSSEDSSLSAPAVTATDASQETIPITDEVTEPETISEAQPETEAVTEVPEENSSYVEYYFASRKLLDSHFEKHGGEFDGLYSTAEEYEKGACDVINNPDALQKTEQEDGDFIFYIEDTNEFVVLSTSGSIRTYFKPSAGKSYFDRQ